MRRQQLHGSPTTFTIPYSSFEQISRNRGAGRPDYYKNAITTAARAFPSLPSAKYKQLFTTFISLFVGRQLGHYCKLHLDLCAALPCACLALCPVVPLLSFLLPLLSLHFLCTEKSCKGKKKRRNQFTLSIAFCRDVPIRSYSATN